MRNDLVNGKSYLFHTVSVAYGYSAVFKRIEVLPNVIEYSIGADRLTLALMCEAYEEQKLEGGDTRVVMDRFLTFA